MDVNNVTVIILPIVLLLKLVDFFLCEIFSKRLSSNKYKTNQSECFPIFHQKIMAQRQQSDTDTTLIVIRGICMLIH